MKNDDRPWEDVKDPSYFKGVMGNMVRLGCGKKSPDAGCVRFGRTGGGIAPNYQIERLAPEPEKFQFNGLGHIEVEHVDETFAPEKISEQFSYLEVERMLARCLDQQKR